MHFGVRLPSCDAKSNVECGYLFENDCINLNKKKSNNNVVMISLQTVESETGFHHCILIEIQNELFDLID